MYKRNECYMKKVICLLMALLLMAACAGTLLVSAEEIEPPAGDSEKLDGLQNKIDKLEQTLNDYLQNQQQIPPEESDTQPPASLKPNVLISNYSFEGDYVSGGQNFRLSFNLYNTSKNIKIQNVVVKINGGEKFALSRGADTLYIDSIAAKKASSQSVDLTTSLDAAVGSYPVSFSVSYEYYDNGVKAEGAAELSVTIPVLQNDKVQINNVGLSMPEVYVGEEYDVVFSIINSGFTKLNNAEVKVLNGAGEELATAYLGTLEASTEKKSNAELLVSFNAAGEQDLKLKLIYEDETLQKKEMEQPFTVQVTEYVSPMPEFPTDDMPPVEEGGVSPVLLIVAGIVVLAVIITIVVVVKKKKNKRSELEDEDI